MSSAIFISAYVCANLKINLQISLCRVLCKLIHRDVIKFTSMTHKLPDVISAGSEGNF